jgi:hypothetical protein
VYRERRKVTVISVCGRNIRVEGRFIRIARLDGDRHRFLDDPELIINALRVCGVHIDLFTFMQRLIDKEPRYSYQMEWENLAVLPVSTFEHWLTKQIRFAPRGRVRQAEKRGVQVREVPFDDTLVEGIWEIYNECPVRQGRRFPHYGIDLRKVHQVEATHLDHSIFMGAYLGEELIGFAKLVHDETRTQANLMNILSLMRHREKCPTNALIAQAVRSCAARGIPSLVYQQFVYGNEKSSSLSNFKEVNGFSRVDVPRYYVPLTRVGSIALRLGFHKRLRDRCPEPVLTKLRGLRTAWYGRKLRSGLETS